MIDLHCHVLPGIDDGPDSIEDSLLLARAAETAGTRTLVATPHVSWRYPNESHTIASLANELSACLAQERIDLTLRTGGEIAMTRLLDIEADELSRLGFGAGHWLLVEPPFMPAIAGLDTMLLGLQGRGHRILLAHPERCHAFHRDRAMLESLVRAGVLTSLTAGSLVGRFGERVRRFALQLVRDGLAHNVASDAHDHTGRPPGMSAELERAGLAPLAEWFTHAVPAAILEDQEIPACPLERRELSELGGSVRARRGLWRRRR
ncbi:MAG TPA: CpsB/CapC family capsule biosynthesis tyrosine phosphatase [Solirubrobacteraceae bacterium]|nr:CpsB/CapC family capsule biosynthesis tyrosine phosphatase [Solirubrobacteraceae bacterium]